MDDGEGKSSTSSPLRNEKWRKREGCSPSTTLICACNTQLRFTETAEKTAPVQAAVRTR